jgi:hypothetical protein
MSATHFCAAHPAFPNPSPSGPTRTELTCARSRNRRSYADAESFCPVPDGRAALCGFDIKIERSRCLKREKTRIARAAPRDVAFATPPCAITLGLKPPLRSFRET